MDEDEIRIIATLKNYHKIVQDASNRSCVIKDPNFVNMVCTILKDSRSRVISQIVQVLLAVTSREEEAAVLKATPVLAAVVAASENAALPIAVLHNLLIISSRLNVAGDTRTPKTPRRSVAPARRFVATKKSQQYTFIVDGIDDETFRADVEKGLLAVKGVVSISFSPEKKFVVLRVNDSLVPQVLVNAFYDAGTERVQRLVRNEMGLIEAWDVAREEQKVTSLPDYIDESEVPPNPQSCVSVKGEQKAGGWMNTISSYFTAPKLW